MEVIQEQNAKQKIKEIEKKYKLHCQYEEKARKQEEEEIKQAAIQAELEKDMPKEKGKKKGNPKSKTIAPKKTDYKIMFTK